MNLFLRTTATPMYEYDLEERNNIQIFNEVSQAVIFKDLFYLITLSKSMVISVWNLKINGEVAQFREQQKVLFIKEWKYVDPSADENYTFLVKDPEDERKK